MDPSNKLTPAQEREARRKLRRAIGDGTPEDQLQRLFVKAMTHAAKNRRRKAVRTLVNGIGSILLDAMKRRQP